MNVTNLNSLSLVIRHSGWSQACWRRECDSWIVIFKSSMWFHWSDWTIDSQPDDSDDEVFHLEISQHTVADQGMHFFNIQLIQDLNYRQFSTFPFQTFISRFSIWLLTRCLDIDLKNNWGVDCENPDNPTQKDRSYCFSKNLCDMYFQHGGMPYIPRIDSWIIQ